MSKAEYQKKWREKNREKMRNYNRNYRVLHREKRTEQLREWRKKNPEKVLNCNRQYSALHKEKRREYAKEYSRKRRKDPEFRKRERLANNKSRDKLKVKVFELLGGQCANPYGLHDKPFIDVRCLQIDHVDGIRDSKDYPRNKDYRGTYAFYKEVYQELLKGSKKYQCLCANCNWIKRSVNHELRMQDRKN
ncbi:MAG: hypothetical protein ABSC20_09705 [Candidatus Bathyarchaeia archaeon]|jgi:hypothetical protein